MSQPTISREAREQMRKILVDSFKEQTIEEINAMIDFICAWSTILVKEYITKKSLPK